MKTLAHHILDIVENSINANAARIEISVEEQPANDRYVIAIKDNGAGIDPESLKQITDAYYTTRTTRAVGLGLALLRQNAEMTGGYVEIDSELQKGTVVRAIFGYSHLDKQPLGDISGTITMLMAANSAHEFRYTHITPEGTYVADSVEIKEALGNMPLGQVAIQRYIREMIEENLREIKMKS